MMIQEFDLENYSWNVKIYYITDEFPLDLIIEDLENLNCENILEVKQLLKSNEPNIGFTFSNNKHSLLVIGPTTSAEEFSNTLDHEKGHLVTHICQYYFINPYGEQKQYLAGEVSRQIYKCAKYILCSDYIKNEKDGGY